ncbi:MAG: nicotinate (nicotinamide) nucleotide adenylyltransferase, partial [Coprobacillus sp.]|nr:nicotinate (nicotinamide) nucleotide adenylyltransferase [Coprobacillus sp.]
MRNIILFGGDFNPVHNGHLNMAVSASKYLGDAPVVFIPAKIAIWKDESVDFKHKVNMLRLAIKDIPNMYISEWENENGKERTYSIETVRHFKELYPDDNLYLLIGNDQVNAFNYWKEAGEISRLVQIIYFVRPAHPLNNDNVHIYNMKKVPGEEKNIDSTAIRNLERSDTAPSVLKYIEENELYYIPKIKSYLIERRYVHTMSVADLSYKIALENKVVDGDK